MRSSLASAIMERKAVEKEEEEGSNLMHQAGQQTVKMEQEAVVVVGIFISPTTAIRPTTEGFEPGEYLWEFRS